MKLEFDIGRELDEKELDQAIMIIEALIATGGLWGVRGGRTVIHFDAEGTFGGIQLDYLVWKRRSKK